MPKGASIVSVFFLFVHFTQCAPTLDSPGQALAITGSWFHQLPVEALLKVRACLHHTRSISAETGGGWWVVQVFGLLARDDLLRVGAVCRASLLLSEVRT